MTSAEFGVAPDHGYRFPLSYAQQRLWFLDQLDPGSVAYNVPLVLRLTGSLNVSALEQALGLLVERHEGLRTTFLEDGDEAVQVVQTADLSCRLDVLDLSGGATTESEALERAAEEANRPFDLAAGPPLRTLIIRLAEEDHILVLTLHHIITDAWSLRVLRRDLAELYGALIAEREPQLPELSVQYGDFAVWQRAWFEGERLTRALEHWKAELRDVPAVLDLPFDKPRPAVQSDRGAHCRAVLGRGLMSRLEALSQDEGATLFMTLLAAFAALLARYSGQDEFVIGTPIANRNRVELEQLIGFFANTLALRMRVGGIPSFRELLRRTRETALRAYANQDLPFEKLVAELNPERSLSHAPLFQVLFQFHETTKNSEQLPGLALNRVELDRHQAKFDLALTLVRANDGLRASFEYSTDLLEASTVERMLANFEMLLEGVLADPDRAIDDVEILSSHERTQLERWNDTRTSRPEADRCVHELFEEQALRTPEAVALAMDDRSVSYADLNARANRLALQLRELGVGPDVPVAVCMERSPELPLALLAVLKAGGAYAPLDPAYPAERLRFMLEETAAPVLITQNAVLERIPEHRARQICIDDAFGAPEIDDANLPLLGTADDLAYILFTSGSTGKPKGVAMPHATLSNLLAWQRDHFRSSAPARTLQFASMSFDVAFQELFSTWTSGGTVILVDTETRRDPELLLALLSAQNVERLFVPYVALQQLAEAALELGTVPNSLREVITAGETLQITSAVREFFALLPECTLENQYGPTESHVVTAFTLEGAPESWPDRPPIGQPIANARIYVVDNRGRLAPIGVPGELHIGGAVLARGYLGRPDLTDERFVADPFGHPGERVYRTGDRARMLADGNVDFLGRLDHQVKVRGFRIEPGEIEVQLASHPAVRDVVVVAREDEPANRRLVGYILAHGSAAPGQLEVELKSYLAALLPEYMVPSAIVVLDQFPLSPNGKIDRSALPAPGNVQPEDRFVPVSSPIEETIASVWSEVLAIQPIGATDNFFDLGGHSLLATRVISRIRKAFDVEIGLRSIFAEPTVAGLARIVDDLLKADRQAEGLVLTPVNRDRHRVGADPKRSSGNGA